MAGEPARERRGQRWEQDRVETVRVGTLIGVDSRGRPLVSFANGPEVPVVARVATPDPGESATGTPVVLILEDGDPLRPVIVGFVRDTLSAGASGHDEIVVSDRTRQVELNGKTLVFEAEDEIVLRCGRGTVTIRADGQIVVKGTRLVSRASETNRIRGASVQIN